MSHNNCGVCNKPFPCPTPDLCEREAVLEEQLGDE